MDYSNFMPDRQEGRSLPENNIRAHQQNQYPVLSEHQQFATGHQVMSTGYPGIPGFGPYIHSLQALGTPASPGLTSSEGLIPSRILHMVQESQNNRVQSQRQHEYDAIHASTVQVPTSSMHYRPEGRVTQSSPLSQGSPQLQQLQNAPLPAPLPPQTTIPNVNLQQGTQHVNTSGASTTGHQTKRKRKEKTLHTLQPHPQPSQPAQPPQQPHQPQPQQPQVTQGRGRPPLQQQQQQQQQQPVIQNLNAPAHPGSLPNAHPPAHQQVRPRLPLTNSASQTDPLFREILDSESTKAGTAELPEGLGYIEFLTQNYRRVGITATKDIPAGKEFGPFTGDIVKEDLGSLNLSTWEICVRGKTRFYINGATDPENWMTNVQVARNIEDQNLEAYQYYGDIFFRTTKKVDAGAELCVFYRDDYAKKVGFKLGLDEVTFDKDSGRFECNECECEYTNPKSLLRHIKMEHDGETLVKPSSEKPPPPQKKLKQESTNGKEKETETQASESTTIGIKTSKTPMVQKRIEKKKKIKEKLIKEKLKQQEDRVRKFERKTRSSRRHLRGAQMKTENGEKQEMYVCDYCEKSFLSPDQLDEHLAFHVEAKSAKWICRTCGLHCKNTKALNQHLLSHDTEASKCPLCKKFFKRRGRMVTHLRNEHNMFIGKESSKRELADVINKPDLADIVNKESDSENSLGDGNAPGDGNAAKEVQSLTSVPTCDECGAEFSDVKELDKHSKKHKNKGRSELDCHFCHKKFRIVMDLIAHFREAHRIFLWNKHGLRKNMKERLERLVMPEAQREHQQEETPFHPDLPKDYYGKRIVQNLKFAKNFKCKYCPKTYTDVNSAIRHEKEVHMNTGNYMCEFCSTMFVDEKHYILHKRKHTQDHPFKCNECPRAFAQETSLEKHLLEHTSLCPFKCDVCLKGFRTRKNMMSHRRLVHQAPKELYPCSFCQRPFKTKAARKRHENCHKGIRPYVCLTCGKAFRQSHILKCHTMIHTGEKPFECKDCHRKFRLPHQLSMHMLIHDKERSKFENQVNEGAASVVEAGNNVDESVTSNVGLNLGTVMNTYEPSVSL